MPIDWKKPESYKRLLAAMCAAQDGNIDFKKVAYYYGQGATYDSIEGRFRSAKKEATNLQIEAEKEGRKMPVTRPKSAASTPRKPKAKPSTENAGVMSGRVTKSPSKKSTKSTADKMCTSIKLELDSSSSAAATPSSMDSEMMAQDDNAFLGLNDMGYANNIGYDVLSNYTPEEYLEA